MKLEIINPSDECYLDTDDIEAAAFATMVIGRGAYGLRDESGKHYCPIMIFGGDVNTEWNANFGHDFDKYTLDTAEDYDRTAAAMETFTMPRERSSLNDIGEAFKRYARLCRNKAAECREASQ